MGAAAKEEQPKQRKWPSLGGAPPQSSDAEENGRDHGTKCVPVSHTCVPPRVVGPRCGCRAQSSVSYTSHDRADPASHPSLACSRHGSAKAVTRGDGEAGAPPAGAEAASNRSLLRLLPAVVGTLLLNAGSSVAQAAWERFYNERVAAKRARSLAKLHIDWELFLRSRMSVLNLSQGGGQSAEWSNAALQALWGSVVTPVVSVHGPPLVDLLLHQLVSAPALLPRWITRLNLVKLDLGTKAPRLVRVYMPPGCARPNGTLHPEQDVYLDWEVEVDLDDAHVVVLATLETAASKLVSRLTAKAHSASVELHLTKIKQACIMRVRLRPQAGVAFLGLLRFTGKPSAEATVHARDVGGVHIVLPVSHFPGSETITAWIVQRIFRLLMALPHRFIPIDFAPVADILTGRTHMGAIPRGGSVRIYIVEARGLGMSGGSANSSPKHRPSSVGDSSFHVAGTAMDWMNDAEDEPGDEAPAAAGNGAPLTATGNIARKVGGIQPYARVEYAFGSKEIRTGCPTGVADDAGCVGWAEHQGVVVVDLLGPADAITISLRRRKVPGPLGRLGAAHFKLYWCPDGSSTIFFCTPDGTPAVLRAALPRASDQSRMAAGVQFSGREGFVDVWLPLVDPAGGDPASTGGAAVRVQLSVDWFGSAHAMSSVETAAALVMQRWVRRWKARKRLAAARLLVSHGTFLPVLQLCVTFQRAVGLPLKSHYTASVQVGPAATGSPAWASAVCHVVPESTCEPVFGTSLVVDVPPQGVKALLGRQPVVTVRLHRYNELVAVATVPLPPGRLTGRGDAVRLVHALEPTAHFSTLTMRAAHKAHRAAASGATEADIPSVILYACIVLKPAPEGTPSAAKGKQVVRAAAPAVELAPDVADILEPESPKLSVRELAARFEPSPDRLSTVPEEGSLSGTPSPSPHSLAFIAAQELAAARREAAELKAAALAAEAEAAALEEALNRRVEESSHA